MATATCGIYTPNPACFSSSDMAALIAAAGNPPAAAQHDVPVSAAEPNFWEGHFTIGSTQVNKLAVFGGGASVLLLFILMKK